jgi:DNA-binding protein H-NS
MAGFAIHSGELAYPAASRTNWRLLMPKSYSKLMKEIHALRAEADDLRRKEAGEVIARIKEAIKAYDLSPGDLFASSNSRRGRKTAKRPTARFDGAARYSDGAGNVWGGRGPRPRWLRDALAKGKSLSDFDAAKTPVANDPAASPKATRKKTKSKRGGTVKYKDEAGNTWTGIGRKPEWFRAALAAGKAAEDMTA